jgi:HAD superfamily hydrolase (TIGR01549 family)
MPIRAVIFDLFDTLVDLHYERVSRDFHAGRPIMPTARRLHAAVAEYKAVDFDRFVDVLFAVDHEILHPRYARDVEVPTEERFAAVVERLGIDAPRLPRCLTEIHMGAIRDHTVVLPQHADLLAELHGRFRLGLCSNFSHSPTALSILEESGLDCHFDAIAISDEVGFRKPRSEIFEVTLERLGVGAGEALHVGDNLHADVQGAGAAGIASVWITRRVHEAERRLQEFDGPAPDFVIVDLAELIQVLDASGS